MSSGGSASSAASAASASPTSRQSARPRRAEADRDDRDVGPQDLEEGQLHFERVLAARGPRGPARATARARPGAPRGGGRPARRRGECARRPRDRARRRRRGPCGWGRGRRRSAGIADLRVDRAGHRARIDVAGVRHDGAEGGRAGVDAGEAGASGRPVSRRPGAPRRRRRRRRERRSAPRRDGSYRWARGVSSRSSVPRAALARELRADLRRRRSRGPWRRRPSPPSRPRGRRTVKTAATSGIGGAVRPVRLDVELLGLPDARRAPSPDGSRAGRSGRRSTVTSRAALDVADLGPTIVVVPGADGRDDARPATRRDLRVGRAPRRA